MSLFRARMAIVSSRPKLDRKVGMVLLGAVLVAAILLASLLQWGSHLLISDDRLPAQVDCAVALQGSILGEKARVAGAVNLLRAGIADQILLSVPKETYWGQRVAPIALAEVEKHYGHEAATRVVFCETDDNVDSTEEEAQALAQCINEHRWHSVAIVTSDYHTRRAGIIWRRTLRRQNSSLLLLMHAVPDPEFHALRWWRERRSAKTFIVESTKLLWTLAGGD